VKIRGLAFAGIESAESEALAAFLRDALGLEGSFDDGVHSFRLADGTALAVIPPGHLVPPSDTILGFLVDGVEDATAELEARGVERDGPLFRSDVFRWQHFRAPDGRFFELLDRRV
jgi:hypothetical protein